MIEQQKAAEIAARKALELFGRKKLEKMDGWTSFTKDIFCLSVAEQPEEEETSPLPVIDETRPWKEVTDINVDLLTGEVSVSTRKNVTIFDA